MPLVLRLFGIVVGFALVYQILSTVQKSHLEISMAALWGWIFLLLIIILIFASCLEGRTKSRRLSAVFLIPITISFFYIFSFPTIRPKIDLDASFAAERVEPVSEPILTALTAEHHNAMEEIKLRIEHDDEWFHIKFLLIGGLLAGVGVLAQLKWGITELFARPITASILAIVLTVAITIDMHVRTSYLVVHQLANWILTHVDPLLNCNKSIFASHCEVSPYISWEQFLRISSGPSKGMHEDFIWNMFQTPHVHLSTWALYVLYIFVLFWLGHHVSQPETPASDAYGMSDRRKDRELLVIVFLFVIVQTALGIFAFMGHAAPASFYEKALIPGGRYWFSGENAGYIFLFVWSIMTFLVALRVFLLFPRIGTVISKGDRIVLVVLSILVIVALGTLWCANIHKLKPDRDRGGLGDFIVKLKDEKWHMVSLILDTPEGSLAKLKENGIHDVIQDAAYGYVQCNIEHKLVDAVRAIDPARPAATCEPSLDGLEFGLKEEDRVQWCNLNKLDDSVKELVACQTGKVRPENIDGDSAIKDSAIKDSAIKDSAIKVFFKVGDYDKEEEYKLPELVVDLKERDIQLKASIIVKTTAVGIWQLKRKEARIVDRVAEFLRMQNRDSIRDENFRHCVGETIIKVVNPKDNGELSTLDNRNPLVREVLFKELVLYKPGLRDIRHGMGQ